MSKNETIIRNTIYPLDRAVLRAILRAILRPILRAILRAILRKPKVIKMNSYISKQKTARKLDNKIRNNNYSRIKEKDFFMKICTGKS